MGLKPQTAHSSSIRVPHPSTAGDNIFRWKHRKPQTLPVAQECWHTKLGAVSPTKTTAHTHNDTTIPNNFTWQKILYTLTKYFYYIVTLEYNSLKHVKWWPFKIKFFYEMERQPIYSLVLDTTTRDMFTQLLHDLEGSQQWCWDPPRCPIGSLLSLSVCS